MEIPHLFRQLLVAGSPQLAALSVGGAVAFPSVLLQQLAGAGRLDTRTASWIGSIHGLAGIPSVVMPSVMQWRGRKFAFLAACACSVAGWLLAAAAADAPAVLLSECLHGFGSNSVHAVSLVSMSEMLAPRYRNVSMALFFVMHSLGIAVVGILGRYLHWKTVSIIMSMPIAIAMIVCCVWPESPSWLAFKGRFDECERSFTWLRGTCEASKRELDEIVVAQREHLARKKGNANRQSLWKTIRSRDFYLPCFHIFVLLNLTYWSGSLVILIYSVEMVQRATHNEDVALYGGIIMNCILFVCVAISAVLIKHFSNKSVLIFSTFFATLCLLSVATVNYLDNYIKNDFIALYLLVTFMVAISLGVLPIVFTIAAELMPVRHRGIGGVFYVIFTCLLHSSSLKLAPYLFEYMNLWGTLLVYAANASVCGVIVWRFVPETKGRTLQQLDDYYTFGSFERRANRDDAERWANGTD